MQSDRVVSARGSIRTAIGCWLTKMAAQGLTCLPFIAFMLYACPDAVIKLVLLLVVCSVLLASLSTAAMMAGSVTADKNGVTYNFLGPRLSIPWNQIEFRKPFRFCLEKPYTISRRGSKEAIKIWPSMTGFEALKNCFADHRISLEEGRSIASKEENFRPFDEVVGESLGKIS
jgi:hypothetical protein